MRVIIFARVEVEVEVAGHSLPGRPKTLDFRAGLVATGQQRSNTYVVYVRIGYHESYCLKTCTTESTSD